MNRRKNRNRRRRNDREALTCPTLRTGGSPPSQRPRCRRNMPVSTMNCVPNRTSAKNPLSPRATSAREGGQMRGKIRIAEDFDAPDPEIEKLFREGGEP